MGHYVRVITAYFFPQGTLWLLTRDWGFQEAQDEAGLVTSESSAKQKACTTRKKVLISIWGLAAFIQEDPLTDSRSLRLYGDTLQQPFKRPRNLFPWEDEISWWLPKLVIIFRLNKILSRSSARWNGKGQLWSMKNSSQVYYLHP